MHFTWWTIVLGVGFVVGCIGAWTTNAARVFIKTLGVPIVVVAMRYALPGLAPSWNNYGLLFFDLVLLGIAAFVGDYLLGLKLGRHDRAGYREDSVGH